VEEALRIEFEEGPAYLNALEIIRLD